MSEATTKLDEVALRKSGFREGIRVTLADGQEWALPPLIFESYAEVDDSGVIVYKDGVPTYGPGNDAELDLLLNVGDVDTEEHFRAAYLLALRLLLSNYTLTNAEHRSLLAWKSDGSTTEMWGGIIAALQGVRPKPSAGGSA